MGVRGRRGRLMLFAPVALALLLTVGLLASGTFAQAPASPAASPVATAPPEDLTAHPAAIYQGSCAKPSTSSSIRLADVKPVVPAGTGAGTPTTGANVGAASAIPMSTSVTTIDLSMDQLVNNSFAVAVMQSRDHYVPIACGNVGGIRSGDDLIFGLAEQGGSHYYGTVWLHGVPNQKKTTVTIFLGAGLEHPVPAPVGTFPPVTSTSAALPAAAPSATAAAPSGSPVSSPKPATTATIDMEDIKFVPNEITIAANTNDQITLDNKGALPHNFSVNAHNNPSVKNLGISVTLQPGQSKTITVNAPAGDYYFYCDEPGHEAAGMFGHMHIVAPTATQPAGPPSATNTSVTVDMEDIKFVPNQFTIPANTDVKITLVNKGALPHDFSVTSHKNPNVKDLNISVTLQPGQSKTITVNAPAGDYYFYCNQPGHEAAGMFGHMLVK